MTKKSKIIICIITILLSLIAGIIVGFYIPHKYSYHMDRVEGDYTEYAVIEIYDESTDTITMVDVKMVR